MKICKIKNCNNKCRTKGYCNKHYQQIWRYGKILKRTKFNLNKIVNYNVWYKIYLYNNNNNKIAEIIIDKTDIKKINKYKWHLMKGYAATMINKKNVYLHQLILNKKEKYITDHINNNRLDNRKQNLRFVTYSQNNMNKKGVKGIYFNINAKKWIARITINKKNIFLGYFINKQNAINARKQAEQKYFGEFAYNINKKITR